MSILYEVTKEFNPPTFDVKFRHYVTDSIVNERLVLSGLTKKTAELMAYALNKELTLLLKNENFIPYTVS